MENALKDNLLKTCLYEEHKKLNAKFINFSNWQMPVFFSSIVNEHNSVRNNIGVFDISHMGQISVSGKDSAEFLNYILTNNINKLSNNQCQYTFLLNDKGGIIDDLIIYKISEQDYLLVVNASKIEEDFNWINSQIKNYDIKIDNLSDNLSGLAIQGPNSQTTFANIVKNLKNKYKIPSDLPERNNFYNLTFDNLKLYICRTGYTGEDGFEMFASHSIIKDIYQECINENVQACGLGARDTLRLESCYPLNGNDLTEITTPLEAGLGFFAPLKSKKANYIGKNILQEQKLKGLNQKLCAIEIIDKSPPPRPNYQVFHNDKEITTLTSASLSPTLKKGIALAYLPSDLTKIDTEVFIVIRNKKYKAKVCKKPFYKK